MKGEAVDKVPVCSVTQTGTVELMNLTGAHWPEAHYDAEKMATLAIAGYEIAGFEAVRCPFDGTAIAQTLGCTINEGTSDTQPSIVDFPCKEIEDIQNIAIPDNFLESERISTILNATKIIREKVGDDVPVVTGMLGPAAISFALAGARNYLMWSVMEPDALKELVQIGTEVCIEYSNALFDCGADVICIPDSEAGPDLVPPEFFKSMILPEYRKIASGTDGLMILHICGDATAILDLIPESGFEGISIEEKTDVGYAREIIGDRACLIGNVSPVRVLLMGSTKDVKEDAKYCIDKGVDILAPGCGLAPHTPLTNMRAFVDARDEYYSQLD
ncbi:MAG: [methyl-Co(III) methanol/glycine betaine-specific corrinoid protein]:coenzyme methyltransferase [Methanohalophilus sp.]|nr:[methyl-Co(III) methanol/glycine betaine-specific corrinoid protein]:coenzyme methyltransferase [Methanohalophilus sp.]